jgi:beta propeller repeat protein
MKKRFRFTLLLIMLATAGSTSGISDLSEIQIITERGHQNYPRVYGSVVVWDNWREGDLSIHRRDLSTGEKIQIAIPFVSFHLLFCSCRGWT